jgi:hypothetical protein
VRAALLLVCCAAATAAAEPAWPTSGGTLDLTWVIQPGTIGSGAVRARVAKVTLEAKLGAVTRTVPLADVAGALSPLDQPMCATAKRDPAAPPPLAYGKGEVGKLVFAGGIVHGYAVRRDKRDQLAIASFDMSDETCSATDCAKPAGTLAIPARVTIREHIVLVDKAGKRAAFSCTID